MKRIEVVIDAESPFGIARGLELVIKKVEDQNVMDGATELPRMGVSIAWRTIDKISATDLDAGTLLGKGPEKAEKGEGDPGGVFEDSQKPTEAPKGPPPISVPDISTMDIEEAKSTVGVASSLDELGAMEESEIQSSRFPGGRKTVLQYIAKVRKDLKKTQTGAPEEDVRFGTARNRQ